MRTTHILLVEGDPSDADQTLAALEDYDLGNDVLVVHDGDEALDYLYCRGRFKTRANGHPVVVVLDNKAPNVRGLEVLKAVKGDEQLKTIPVVVLASSRETPDLIEFYRHGANSYVVKPSVFCDFMRVVKQLGVFWTTVNETPPHVGTEEPVIQQRLNL